MSSNGRSGQEGLEPTRRARRDKCQDAEREGDISRHRNRPPTRRQASVIAPDVSQGRNDHSADGPGDRQRRLTRRGQFARKRFALDLEADQQKKHGHECVVDPLMNGECQRVIARANGDRHRQKAMVYVSPPGIRDHQRRAYASDE